ncbi:hypothetical protein HanIR_Chr09g0446871 [Helianthus annuus]|nr:hypothetical protein HanIR_Chr09g0446871 [Helianthus annuus]
MNELGCRFGYVNLNRLLWWLYEIRSMGNFRLKIDDLFSLPPV